jgi:hypothetical protein
MMTIFVIAARHCIKPSNNNVPKSTTEHLTNCTESHYFESTYIIFILVKAKAEKRR